MTQRGSWESAREVEFKDLEQFAPRIRELISENPVVVRHKTRESVLREYGTEKWGSLVDALARESHPDVRIADALFLGDEMVVASEHERFYVTSAIVAHERYCAVILDEIAQYRPRSVVDLGSGYGSVVLRMAERDEFLGCRITACDLTESGIACMRLLAASSRIELMTKRCDLAALDLSGIEATGSVITTSWAMGYLHGFPEQTLEAIVRARPKFVIHFEPVYEHWDSTSAIGRLRRRYHEVNDYNRHFLRDLRGYQASGKIRIVREDFAVFGESLLSPISVVAWVVCE